MILSTVRLVEDDIDTEDFSEERRKKKADNRLLVSYDYVCMRDDGCMNGKRRAGVKTE